MSNESYVLMHTKVKCSKGCIANYINVGTDHGVCKMEGDSKYPILNCSDFKVKDNITDFGGCRSDINPEYLALSWEEKLARKAKDAISKQGLCGCSPLIPSPWFNTNLKAKLENSTMLTCDSKLVCSKGGGIITIEVEKQ